VLDFLCGFSVVHGFLDGVLRDFWGIPLLLSKLVVFRNCPKSTSVKWASLVMFW